MAHVERRQQKRADGTSELRWRARWRDPSGAERSRTFVRKGDAERFLAGVEGDKARGLYIDPSEGRQTVERYAAAWLAAQVHRPTTRAQYESYLRNHILSQLGSRSIGSLTRTDVQGWVKGRAAVLAPATVHTVYKVFATMMRAAAADRVIGSSPCHRIQLPKMAPRDVLPLSGDQVADLIAAMPERYAGIVIAAVGSGLRQGELLGLRRQRVDFLRRQLEVAEQLVVLPGAPPYLAPPKTAASCRTVPLPAVVVEALARQLKAFGSSSDLVFTTDAGEPIRRTAFHARVWVPSLRRAGLPVGTRFHGLRHTYASLLIEAGEHPKTIQIRLGHASITETMDTYGHLFPESEDRTRAAIDKAAAAWLRPDAVGG